jgi:hypothetical protein
MFFIHVWILSHESYDDLEKGSSGFFIIEMLFWIKENAANSKREDSDFGVLIMGLLIRCI